MAFIADDGKRALPLCQDALNAAFYTISLTMRRWPDTLSVLLTERGWNQAELGRLLGVSRQAVGYWIRGVTMPKPRQLEEVAKKLRVPLSVLLGEDAQVLVADQDIADWARFERLTEEQRSAARAMLDGLAKANAGS